MSVFVALKLDFFKILFSEELEIKMAFFLKVFFNTWVGELLQE